ncbi:hypothetical protein [Virgibacillus senegalensis]|uniref:hypothetical protein n=1 Tax=Virgibacillus senegalensis TaxID=1499679 RepID=UPI00069EC7BE|nr:hypothetical protein [Virgibacillus senegalensis]
MGIMKILAPIVIVGAIGLFVVLRLKHKYNNGTLGKKKTKSAQTLLDSLIPLGMILGCLISVIFNMNVGLGAGVGFFLGYLAYEIYSKKEESTS